MNVDVEIEKLVLYKKLRFFLFLIAAFASSSGIFVLFLDLKWSPHFGVISLLVFIFSGLAWSLISDHINFLEKKGIFSGMSDEQAVFERENRLSKIGPISSPQSTRKG